VMFTRLVKPESPSLSRSPAGLRGETARGNCALAGNLVAEICVFDYSRCFIGGQKWKKKR
jgi:hypothetical protein